MSITCRLFIGLVVDPCIGQWFDVTDTDDVDTAFTAIELVARNHGAEEVMIADSEPSWLGDVSRSDLGEMVEWLSSTTHREDIVVAVQSHDPENFRTILDEHGVSGPFRDRAEYAESFCHDTGSLDECPKHLVNYIDFDSMARDWILGGDVTEIDGDDGHYYYNNNC